MLKTGNIDLWSYNREEHEVTSFLFYAFIYVFPSALWAAVQHILSFRIEEINKGIKRAKCERNIEYSEESCLFLPSLQKNLSSVLDQCILSWCKNLIKSRLLHLCALLLFIQYMVFDQELLIYYDFYRA